METALIPAQDVSAWREALAPFPAIDVCQTPEYHGAYATRTPGSRPLLWTCAAGGEHFGYPFLLAPARWRGSEGEWEETGYADISSIYGYSGPLATTSDPDFLAAAWSAFDAWAEENKVVAEFIRFSPHAGTVRFAHPGCTVEPNREIAVSRLPGTEADLIARLDSKTRNMIRKAAKAGLAAKELVPDRWIPAFRVLYDETMARNVSPEFFSYDDDYYRRLLSLPAGEFRLFGVFQGDDMVAGSIALVHGKGALYHLGASRREFSHLGANNLCLSTLSEALIRSGVDFLNLGGGRTTAADDPLLRFKKSNALGSETYQVGKRVVDTKAYADLRDRWQATAGSVPDGQRMVFWR